MINLVFALIAVAVLPTAYVLLCRRMKQEGIVQAPHIPFFFSFGTLGGICVMIALSPSPLIVPCYLPIALSSLLSLGAAAWLCFRKDNSRYHTAAMASGFVASVPFMLLSAVISLAVLAHATS